MGHRWRSPCGAYTVVLEVDFTKAAIDLARKHFPEEVGTALVGTYSDDGWEATIKDVAPLTTDSKSACSTFTRGSVGLREHFETLFSASNGRTHYVGEWHSHPNGTPEPSLVDDQSMFEIASDPSERCPHCILVIVGTDQNHEEMGVFVYSKKRSGATVKIKLEQIENLNESIQ